MHAIAMEFQGDRILLEYVRIFDITSSMNVVEWDGVLLWVLSFTFGKKHGRDNSLVVLVTALISLMVDQDSSL